MISEAGPARVPISASAPPPSQALPGGARSQVCPSQVCLSQVSPSQVCRPAAAVPNKEIARALLLAKHFGLGALLTLPVPSSSWDVLEAAIAPLPLAGLQPRASGPCKDNVLNPHRAGVPVPRQQSKGHGEGTQAQSHSVNVGQPWPSMELGHPVHGARLPGPGHEGAAAWMAVLLRCLVPHWPGWGHPCPWCCQ